MKLAKQGLRRLWPVIPILLLIVIGTAFWSQTHRNPLRGTGRDEDEQGEQNPKLWEERFLRGRRGPEGHTATYFRLKALDQKGRMPLARPTLYGSPARPKGFSVPPSAPPLGPSCDWTELGPAPENDVYYGKVSGRVTSLALDLAHDPTGNTAYVGTAYGGLWKTTNGLVGSPSFSPISDQTQSLAMGSVALDTSVTPPVIYIGTGELNMAGDSYYGVGILKSPDGGSTWSLVSTANGGAISFLGLACSKILVDPSSPSTVLACMGFSCCHDGLTNLNQGLYRSTDSGASWTQVTTVNGGGQAISGHSFTDVIYDGSATFYAAVRFQGIYRSTDHGASWTQVTSPFPSGTPPDTNNFARGSLAFRGGTLWCLAADSSDNLAKPAGGDTGLSQSTDGGNTWTVVRTPNQLFNVGFGAQGTYDQFITAPPGASSLVVGGIDAYFTANVNGNATTWGNLTQSYTSGITHPDQHAIACLNANTWYLGNDGGVWTTTNTGNAFSNINNNLGTIQFYGIGTDPSRVGGFLGGTQDNGSPYTAGGVTWTDAFGGDGGYVGSNPSIFGQFYGEHFLVGLYRVDNFGSSFVTVVDNGTIPSAENSAILVPFKVIPGASPQVVYGTSRIWRGPGNASHGSGWATISGYLTGSNNGDVESLDVAPSNPNYIYATTFDGTATYQVYSNGGGASWNSVSTGLPTTNPLVGIAVDPTNPLTAYVGVQGFVGSGGVSHVYQTTNGGTGWTDITGNLPDAPVNSILVDPLFPGDIYVANDVGVFATQNVNGSGTSWARLGTSLPDSTVLQIQMSTTCPRVIVAGTHGRGAWSICPLSSAGPCPTHTPTPTPTFTATPTATFTVTFTPIFTNTPTITPTPPPADKPPVLFPNPYPDLKDPAAPSQLLLTLSAASNVHYKAFTVNGLKVLDGDLPNVLAGVSTQDLDLRDKWGSPLANGLYYLVVDTGRNRYVIKMLILR